ncbi:MAG: family transcriptional regulator, regulator of embCAB operon [Mycobacteriales bacterium]|jgi:DNA-binding SARP family transcriptional activator
MQLENWLYIGLLGPVAAWWGDQEVYVGPARQREVLAVLAFRAGQVMSVGEIAREVWGERQPSSVENLVHTYVGRLRGALTEVAGRDMLRSNRPGYVLAVRPQSVDVTRFEDFVRQGRAAAGRGDLAAAAAAFDAALQLWRGPVLLGASGPVAEAERVRLNEMKHEVVEELMRVRLLLGDVRGLVPELKRMIVRDPLRERLWALLLMVLGQTSRTAEALTVYHEARVTLAEQLGVEPGHELQQLYRSLLRGEPMVIASPW